MKTLEVEGLVAGYGGLDILHGVDVWVDEGEVVTVMGPNGAGKSTLLKAIVGLADVREGKRVVLGQSVEGLRPEDMAAAGLAYVPQLRNVFPRMRVDENLRLGMVRGDEEQALHDVFELFPLLEGKAKTRAHALSGGQRQMLAMGRALMARPRLLLLDEPSAGMAPKLVHEAFQQVRRVADAGTPVLLVEQNAKQALGVSDRAVVLDAGLVRHMGPAQGVLADPELGRMYLGAEEE